MQLEVREMGGLWMMGYEGMDVVINAYETKASAVKAAQRHIKKYSRIGGTVKVSD